MTKELMQLEVDSDLKKAFLACVSRAYNGKVEEGTGPTRNINKKIE